MVIELTEQTGYWCWNVQCFDFLMYCNHTKRCMGSSYNNRVANCL